MDSILSQLSSATAGLARDAALRLYHVPSPAGGRTALSFDGRRLLVPAREAEQGEEVAVIAPDGKPDITKVIGFDPALGFAILELAEPRPGSAWVGEDALPALGSLLLAVAFPSDEGVEARLDLVRIARGDTAGARENPAGAREKAESDGSYLQTDGASFPGFDGGALVSPAGKLAGVIAADRPGNHGWAIPAARAKALVEAIVAKGFPSRAWLGVSTLPVELPSAWRKDVEGRTEAAMVVGVEAGSPAEAAGLLPGDLILSLGGAPIASPETLRETIAGLAAGKAAKLVLLRGGARVEASVTPGERGTRQFEHGEGEHGEGCGCGQGHHEHHGHHGHHDGHGLGHGSGLHGHGHRHHHHEGMQGDDDCCGGGDCGCSTDR
jgi:S1-C subfamily serine protease